MYVVIVGAGSTGRPLVEMATRDGNEVVVVERDRERAERAASELDCLVVHDDATSKEALLDAGVDRADALVSTTDQDATNVMVCLLAQELSVPSVVSVVHNPEHMSMFRQVGVHTIENPSRLIADYLLRAVQRPSIVDFMRVGEAAEVFEITAEAGAPVAGRTLESSGSDLLPEDVLVVAVDRGADGDLITPRGGTHIEAGDLLTVYSADGVTPELTAIFGHETGN